MTPTDLGPIQALSYNLVNHQVDLKIGDVTWYFTRGQALNLSQALLLVSTLDEEDSP